MNTTTTMSNGRSGLKPIRWGLPLLLLLLLGSTAHAATNWTVAKRDDQKIIKLVSALNKKLVSRPNLQSEPAFVLLKSEVYKVDLDSHEVFTSHIIQVNNPDLSDAATRKLSIYSNAKILFIGAWILRDGKVIRMTEEIWDVVKGDKTRRTEIIFAFPDVQHGDVLGLSIEEEYDSGWGGAYLWISETLPVMMSRTRIQTKGLLAYRIAGMNLRRDKWSKKVLEKKHDVPCDVRMTIVDIPAVPTGKYTPNAYEYMPYLMVNYRGIWDNSMRHWRFNVSWNEVAVSGASRREYLDKHCNEAVSLALSVAGNYSTPVAKADALHRYIRDEIVDVSFFEIQGKRDIKGILKSGQATRFEKGYLMYTMCRSLGLTPDLFVGRNRSFGGIDKGNPYFSQFTDAVVLLKSDGDHYYVPAEDECPPGVLPFNLRGMEVMKLELDMRDRMDDVWHEALDIGGGRWENRWLAYVDLIRKADFVRWEILPGDPDAVASKTVENIRFLQGKNELSIDVTGQGFCELRDIIDTEGDDSEHLWSYLESRLPSGDVLSASTVKAPTIDAPVEISGRVSVDPLPPVMGDNWILPGDAVFGKVFLEDWDGDLDTPFQVRMACEHKFVWRTPLPENWDRIRAKPGLKINHPYIQYNCLIQVEDDELVVTRTCRLKRGLLWSKALADFAKTVQKIQDFERSPLVLEKKQG